MSDAPTLHPSLFEHQRSNRHWTRPARLVDLWRALVVLSVTLSPLVVKLGLTADLRVIAKTGTAVGGQTIANIRPGVSINNRGTIAFAASTSSGRGALLAMTPDGQLIEPRSTGTLVSGYGVQINDSDDIAFLVGPGISAGFDYCIPPDPPAAGCLSTLSAAEVVFSILTINALNPAAPTRTLTYSYITEAQNPIVNPRNGPWTSLGPAFSFNNAGQIAFLGDVSANRQLTSYALGTVTALSTFPTPRPVDILSRPMLADSGRIVYKAAATENSPVLVTDYALSTPTTIASASDGFAWLGLYPGITDSGQRVAFTGRFTGNPDILPPGDGLFLSSFINGQWTNRLVLGTNHWGTNIFSRFHSYYRTCIAELTTRANSVKICFGAAAGTGRVGLYAVTYDYLQDEVVSLETLLEAGRDVAGLGNPTSFELFDAVNDHGEAVLWVQTSQGDAVIQKATVVEAIDPLPELLANGTIVNNDAQLAAATNKVQGLAADGVTRVVLRLETPGQGLVTFSLRDELGQTTGAGTLTEIGSIDEKVGVTTPSRFVDGKWMAFAILRAPTNFVRLSENDEPLMFRRLNVRVEFVPSGHIIPEEIARGQFRLHRPPIAILHGLWSDRDTWHWPLQNDQRFSWYAGDYHESNAASFSANVSEAKRAVEVAILRVRARYKIAAVQADFVGHSMGGLLARLYVAGGSDGYAQNPLLRYKRPDNYFQGDIHKLISLDTPHSGSELADLLIAPDGGMYPAALVLEPLLGCMHCGAVADLRTYSNPIRNLPSAIVPAHAIVGTGGRDVQLRVLGGSLLLGPYLGGLVRAINFIPTAGFLLQTHDLIVSETSQQGGLSAAYLSDFDYENLTLNLNLGIHFTVTKEGRIGEHVIRLLNTSVTGGLFALDGFPANSPVLAPAQHFSPAGAPLASPFVQGLNFTSPATGLAVAPDSSIATTVTAINGFQPVKVLIIGPWGANLDDTAPFDLTVNVPTNWLGPLVVKAFGVDANGVFAESPELILNVKTTATLTNLTLRPDTVYLFDYAQTKQIEVYGQFSDGVERKLAASEQRLITVNPTVATVTTSGLVAAHQTGQTVLWVRTGTLAASAPILVLGTPFTNTPARPSQQLEVIDLGSESEVLSLIDLNNAGQVLLNLSGSPSVRPAIWENGRFTHLNAPPFTGVTALTESGVVGGGLDGKAIVWLTPTNFTYVTYNDGTALNGDFWLQDLQDSETGLIGIVNQSSVGTFGDVTLSSYRLNGTQIPAQSITPQGAMPSGFAFAPPTRIDRNGTLIAPLWRIQGDTLVARRAARIDGSNNLTVLPFTGPTPDYVDANSLNDDGEVVGSIHQFNTSSEAVAMLWRNGTPMPLWAGRGAAGIAVNNRGHVALYRFNDLLGNETAIWANGQLVRLADLLGPDSDWSDLQSVVAMNDNGWLICAAHHRTLQGRKVLVKLGPAIRAQPISRTKVPGQSVTFSVVGYGIEAAYQWQRNGTNLMDGPRVSGSATTQLVISQVEAGDAGLYSVVLTDAYGSVTSSNASLTVIAGDCLPTTSGLVMQWTGDGTDQELLNRSNARMMNGASFSNGIVRSAFALDGMDDFVATDLGIRESAMPSATFEAWVLPTRVNHNANQIVFDGAGSGSQLGRCVFIEAGRSQFSIATGTPVPWKVTQVSPNEWQHIAVVFTPTDIEFYKNGQRFRYAAPLSGAQGENPLTIGSIHEGSGNFQGLIDEVSIYNRALLPEEIQTIYDVGAAGKCRPSVPPILTSLPESQPVYPGFDAPFAVTGQGSATISYQWYFNSTKAIGNATNRQFTLRNVQPADAGAYRVVLSNSFGTVTSSVANLFVRGACENGWTRADRIINPWQDFFCMSYDSMRNVAVMFSNAQTLEWDGTRWRLTADSQHGPPGRANAAMVFDSARGVVVLFGGLGGANGGALNDTWEWDGSNWVLAAADNAAFGPPPRYGHAMAYDSRRGVTVAYGGTTIVSCGGGNCHVPLGDTWEWDGISWTQAAAPTLECPGPGLRRDHQMVYDPARHRIVSFGGVFANGYATNDTWQWDGACWKPIQTAQAPPPRYDFGMAYHAGRGSAVLYGGGTDTPNSEPLADTWELVGDAWVRVPTSGPGPRVLHQLVYDSARDVLILAHNYSDFSGGYGETWQWKTPRAPVVVQQPIGGTRFVGESNTLSICAVGQGDLTYQWFFNRTNALSGANQSVLILDPLQAMQTGDYSVVINNSFGAVTSVIARLIVLPCQPAPAGLVSLWRGEGDARDSLGTNHGVLVNGPTFAVGKVGQAFRFDGVDGFVVVPRSTNLFLRDAVGFTIEGWIQPRDWKERPVVEWNSGGNDNTSVGVHLWSSLATNGGPGSLFANIRGTNPVDHILLSAPGLLTTGAWQHVAVTYARALGAAVLYLNGTLVATQAIGSFRTATTTDVYLGARPGTPNVFAGLMDEISIYNRALTAAEIGSIHEAGSAGKCQEPDGAPYVYFNGVNPDVDPAAVLGDPPATVAMLTTFDNGTIRYTLDGSSPTNGTPYAGTFPLFSNATVRAIAYTTNGLLSAETTHTITLVSPASLGPNHLRIIAVTPTSVTLLLRGVAGRLYTLEKSKDLRAWTSAGSAIAGHDGSALFKDMPRPSGAGFYRASAE